MILFFGPTGSGKSMQGQILAARQGWRWLSAGQLLRDIRDPELLKIMQTGKLVDTEKINQIICKAISDSADISKVVLDGFPRTLEQARWLVSNQSAHRRSISIVFVIDVPMAEIEKRLHLRGRADDSSISLEEKMRTYDNEVGPILNYFKENNIEVSHIDGSGSVGKVHDRIMEELVKCKLA